MTNKTIHVREWRQKRSQNNDILIARNATTSIY